MRRCGNITWAPNGSVAVNGSRVVGANIVDLVGDALRERRRAPPTGRPQFVAALREANVPREFIGNKALWAEITAAASASTRASTSSNSSPSSDIIAAHGFNADEKEQTHFVSADFDQDHSDFDYSLSRRQRKNAKRRLEGIKKKSFITATPKKNKYLTIL